MDSVSGKVAIVTGAAGGIGNALATALARAGASVVIADINGEGAAAAAEQLQQIGPAAAVRTDITNDESVAELAAFTQERFGRVDIVVNDVAAIAAGPPELIPIAEWQRILDINLFGMVRMNAVFIPIFLGQGSGHIVNVTSTAGLYPYNYDRLPYNVSKAAIMSLSEGLALYLRPQGVGVTCLAIGPTTGGNIGKTATRYGGVSLRPPVGVGKVPLERIGEQLVEAIEQNLVVQFTHPVEVPKILVERATDQHAFVLKQIEVLREADRAQA
jgi:NAD(P)-dependent dehydrogenase (short-subunit alcohol dehydrogenase family)